MDMLFKPVKVRGDESKAFAEKGVEVEKNGGRAYFVLGEEKKGYLERSERYQFIFAGMGAGRDKDLIFFISFKILRESGGCGDKRET